LFRRFSNKLSAFFKDAPKGPKKRENLVNFIIILKKRA
jgi:hypothetical protein